jgi:hypothetical protein
VLSPFVLFVIGIIAPLVLGIGLNYESVLVV